MNDYNEYITAVNKIFDYLAKMRTGWDSLDNINYIEKIEDYKTIVISNVETFKKPPTMPKVQENQEEKETSPEEKKDASSTEGLETLADDNTEDANIQSLSDDLEESVLDSE